jgi:regulator of cell morphogenesis and NO signaling
MNPATFKEPRDLIGYVLARFHETHRRELPEILSLARLFEVRGNALGLTDRLSAMGEALESHMFKEEMRLFPMMEQGGNSLIKHLINDMRAEHLNHRVEIASVESLLASLSAEAGGEQELTGLRAAVGKLFDDLAQHIVIEDDILFPMFISPGVS